MCGKFYDFSKVSPSDFLQSDIFQKKQQKKKQEYLQYQTVWIQIRPRGYKTFFILNSAEHEIYPAHKCQNANNCWHLNIY